MTRLTLQQVFDKGLKGIWDQDCRQALRGGVCVYDNGNGQQCWIGHCVPKRARGISGAVATIAADAKAGRLPQALVFMAALPEELMQDQYGPAMRAISSMQNLHDRLHYLKPTEFLAEAEKLAKKYGLTYTDPRS